MTRYYIVKRRRFFSMVLGWQDKPWHTTNLDAAVIIWEQQPGSSILAVKP